MLGHDDCSRHGWFAARLFYPNGGTIYGPYTSSHRCYHVSAVCDSYAAAVCSALDASDIWPYGLSSVATHSYAHCETVLFANLFADVWTYDGAAHSDSHSVAHHCTDCAGFLPNAESFAGAHSSYAQPLPVANSGANKFAAMPALCFFEHRVGHGQLCNLWSYCLGGPDVCCEHVQLFRLKGNVLGLDDDSHLQRSGC